MFPINFIFQVVICIKLKFIGNIDLKKQTYCSGPNCCCCMQQCCDNSMSSSEVRSHIKFIRMVVNELKMDSLLYKYEIANSFG